MAAIDTADEANLREELGDLLLQSVFHSQIASDENRFTLDDVARGITEKLLPPASASSLRIGRSPPTPRPSSSVGRKSNARRKRRAGAAAAADGPPSALDGISGGMPALIHAEKVQKKAAKVGFDWSAAEPVIAKVREEIAEVEEAIATGSAAELEGEIGDLLFSIVNLARKLHVEAEVALRRSTEKFNARFRELEKIVAARGQSLEKMTLPELDAIWNEGETEGGNEVLKKTNSGAKSELISAEGLPDDCPIPHLRKSASSADECSLSRKHTAFAEGNDPQMRRRFTQIFEAILRISAPWDSGTAPRPA